MKRQLSLAAALLLLCTTAYAQHDHGTKKPQMDPAMMEAMMKAGTPGEAHKKIDAFSGQWNAKVTFWTVPGADPMTMEGTAESRWILDGRYLEQRFKGTFMGAPFEGLGYTGYDNVKKRYWSTWIDNMSTGIMTSTGSADGATWTFSGTMPDPMTGKEMQSDSKIIVQDADHHVMEMWGPGPDGKMYKNMEIAYARRK